VQVLLTAGVDSNSHYDSRKMRKGPSYKNWRRREPMSCLWDAVDQEHVEIARLLLAFNADPNTQYCGVSALNASIEKANEELFDILIENGASTTAITTEGARYDTIMLPVHCAASVGNIHILHRLLELGLEPDSALVPDGWTALFHAAKAGHEEVLRILINDYHANFNQHANKGTIAIHTAAYHNHPKCVEVFLDAGLDINVRGRYGRTALHWAVQEGSIDAVRVLLEKGADVSLEMEENFMTALDIAKDRVLEISESQKSSYDWKKPRDESYGPILKMLEEAAEG